MTKTFEPYHPGKAGSWTHAGYLKGTGKIVVARCGSCNLFVSVKKCEALYGTTHPKCYHCGDSYRRD